MRFGVYLPTYWDHYGDSSMPAAIVAAARAAEALGYDSAWANDKIISGNAVEVAQVIEPLVTLGTLVHLAPRIRLGTGVIVLPQRDPILLAKQAAALDLLSGHRVILGVGIGHAQDEFERLGADFAHRAGVTDEGIEVMRALWREPTVSYDGRYYRLDPMSMPPHPPDGGPPIWIGGDSMASIRRAARYGDGWLPFNWDLDAFRAGASLLRELTTGRPCPTIANVFVLRIERPGESEPARMTTPWLPNAFAGSVDAVAERIDRYRQAGLDYAVCGFLCEDLDDLLRQLHAFADAVAPQLAGSAQAPATADGPTRGPA